MSLHPPRGFEFEDLHGFLADSLPEGWGALLLHRRLRQLGVRSDELSAVDRLALDAGWTFARLSVSTRSPNPKTEASLQREAVFAKRLD